jgi:hypothetical protein
MLQKTQAVQALQDGCSRLGLPHSTATALLQFLSVKRIHDQFVPENDRQLHMSPGPALDKLWHYMLLNTAGAYLVPVSSGHHGCRALASQQLKMRVPLKIVSAPRTRCLLLFLQVLPLPCIPGVPGHTHTPSPPLALPFLPSTPPAAVSSCVHALLGGVVDHRGTDAWDLADDTKLLQRLYALNVMRLEGHEPDVVLWTVRGQHIQQR